MGSVFLSLVRIGSYWFSSKTQTLFNCSGIKSSRQLRKTAGRQPLHDDARHFQDLAMQLHFPHRITCGSGMLADELTMNRASMILSHVHTIPNHELVNVIHGVCVK